MSNRKARPLASLFLVISPKIFIEGVAQNACESLADVIFIELFDSHYRGIILSAEPLAAMPTLTPSSSVATRHSASKLASALAAPSVRSADVATIATGVSQARPRLRLGRGGSRFSLLRQLLALTDGGAVNVIRTTAVRSRLRAIASSKASM